MERRRELALLRRNRHRENRPGRNSAPGTPGGLLKESQTTGACPPCRVWYARASCRRCIPHARGRAIKRMQIKTFYLNDNITLVDATALA